MWESGRKAQESGAKESGVTQERPSTCVCRILPITTVSVRSTVSVSRVLVKVPCLDDTQGAARLVVPRSSPRAGL